MGRLYTERLTFLVSSVAFRRIFKKMFDYDTPTPNPTKRLLAVVMLPLFITACESSNGSLIDLSSLFPETIVTNPAFSGADTNPETTPNPTEDIVPEAPQDDDIITETPPDTSNRISPELELLTRGDLVFESRFFGPGDPIQDVFNFTTSDYDLLADSDNVGALINITDTLSTICAFDTSTRQYVCLRAFDLQLNERVWHLFELDSASTGTGVFEFCTEQDTEEACTNKLIDNPDGTDIVTIRSSNELALLPNAAPYFAYGEQGTVNGAVNRQASFSAADGSHLITINALVAAADRLMR